MKAVGDAIIGRNMTAVWPVATKPYKEAHFATFPLELVAIPIRAGCLPEGLVPDPFVGSGTTASVALELNSRFIGIELNPEYVRLTYERLLATGAVSARS